jgi:hypothetical protein
MSPEIKKRTPTGIKTRAAGIFMSERDKEQHKAATEEYEKLLKKTPTEDDCYLCSQILFGRLEN